VDAVIGDKIISFAAYTAAENALVRTLL